MEQVSLELLLSIQVQTQVQDQSNMKQELIKIKRYSQRWYALDWYVVILPIIEIQAAN